MDMFSTVKNWIEGLPRDRKETILEGLTREGVRQGRHHDEQKRRMEQGMPGAHFHGPPQQGGYSGQGGQGGQGLKIGGFNVSQGAEVLGFQDPSKFFPGSREAQESSYQQSYQRQESTYEEPRSQGYGRQTETYSQQRNESYSQGGYDQPENASFYGRSEEHEEYQKPSHHKKKHHKKEDEDQEESRGYGQQESYGGYGSSAREVESESYGQRQTYNPPSRQTDEDSYGRRDTYRSSSRRADEDSYGHRGRETYTSRRDDDSFSQPKTYSSQRTSAYGQREEQGSPEEFQS